MFQLLIVLDQILRMFLSSQQLPQTLVGSLPDSFVHSPDQLEHGEDYLQPSLNQLVLIAFSLQHHLACIVDVLV